MRSVRAAAVAAHVALVLLTCVPTHSVAQGDTTRSVGVTVAESATATVRMLNLTRGARLAFAVQAHEPLSVLFMDEAAFNRFPQESAPVIRARVAKALSFGVQVPEGGNYYLVLDNRENAAPNKVQMQLRATLPATARKSPQDKQADPKPQIQQF